MDKDGLIPGEDWNHQLNLWLAECHVAIVLFSKRAIEKSDWVAKEAAILSWRAELDKDFTLIPVMLDGESTPEDLAKDFLGVSRSTPISASARLRPPRISSPVSSRSSGRRIRSLGSTRARPWRSWKAVSRSS